MPAPNFKQFLVAIWKDWASRLSGIFSVPFTILAIFSKPENARPIYIILAATAILVTIYRVWGNERERIIVLQRGWEEERKRMGRPQAPELKVQTGGLSEETRYTIVPIPGGARTRSVPFSTVVLRITNDPATPTPESIASRVGATLTFCDSQGQELFSFDGRWGDTAQPPHLEQNQDRFGLLTVDFPIGRTRELNIAIKYSEDRECYAVNNDSYGHPLLKNPKWRLDGDEFSVRIRVRGVYVDRAWIVRFRNLGGGRGLAALSCDEAESRMP